MKIMLGSLFRRKEFNKLGFQDMLYILNINENNVGIIISTLPVDEQSYLIKKTVPLDDEVDLINELLCTSVNNRSNIIIYGKNNMDKTIETKYSQLITLGYLEKNLFIYYGGLFEWSLLRDIYGKDMFETIGDSTDPLHFASKRIFLIE